MRSSVAKTHQAGLRLVEAKRHEDDAAGHGVSMLSLRPSLLAGSIVVQVMDPTLITSDDLLLGLGNIRAMKNWAGEFEIRRARRSSREDAVAGRPSLPHCLFTSPFFRS